MARKHRASAPIMALFLACSALQALYDRPVGVQHSIWASMTQTISGSGDSWCLASSAACSGDWLYTMRKYQASRPVAAMNRCLFMGHFPSPLIRVDGLSSSIIFLQWLFHFTELVALLLLAFMLITNFLC